MTEQEFKVFAEKVKSGKLLKIQYVGVADSIRILNVYKENRKDIDEKLRYAADIEVQTKNYQMMYRNFLSVVRNSMNRKEVTDPNTHKKKEVYTIRLVDLFGKIRLLVTILPIIHKINYSFLIQF